MAGELRSVRPVDLDDLVRELACREDVWRDPGGLRPLEAEIHEGQQDRVLVCGGVAALVQQLEDSLGKNDRAALVRVAHLLSQ
jgi:hypothetical protein